jgi:hypothetical protein
MLLAANQNEAGEELIEEISLSNRITVLHETVITYHLARETDSQLLKNRLDNLTKILKMTPM